MTDISSTDIDHLATLARIRLDETEKQRLSEDLPKIVGFVDELSTLAKQDETNAGEAQSLSDLRADEPKSDSLRLEQLDKLAPAWRDNQVEVPAVFGEDHGS